MAPPTQPSAATPQSIRRAADLLQAGELVAFPTETVYGLGADATNATAIARVFEAKGRPSFNPLIVHVTDSQQAATHADWPDLAAKLADAFWPGPLTLVVPRRADTPVCALVSAGLDTLALRVPSHPVARELLQAVDRPIAAPSANPSGRLSPTTAAHVRAGLGDKAALILDDGPCPGGLESTVVDATGGVPMILREGLVDRPSLEAVAGAVTHAGSDDGVRSPGMLARHYAPRRPLRLGAREVAPSEALLAFGPDVPAGAAVVLNLSSAGDLVEAAANLFAHLHALDADHRQISAIAVMPVPNTGLGAAINDRLQRAAATHTPS